MNGSSNIRLHSLRQGMGGVFNMLWGVILYPGPGVGVSVTWCLDKDPP